MKARFLAPIVAALLLASGCSSQSVYRLTDQEFAPRASADEVRMYLGVLQRPHVKIAYVNSPVNEEKTVAVKRGQLAELQKRAAELGADAVMDIRLLKEKHRGMIPDTAVPFPAWKQYKFELYFLRGVAVRFTDETGATNFEWEEEAAGLMLEDKIGMEAGTEAGSPPEAGVEEVPEQRTTDLDDESAGTGEDGY